MERKRIIKAGEKFHRLTILEELEPVLMKNGKHVRYFKCRCDCGNIKKVAMGDLGHTKSCGCYNRESTIERNKQRKKYNKYEFMGDVCIGFTAKGEPFIFDSDDYDKVKNYCWHLNQNNYVEHSTNPGHLFLHRLVTKCPPNKFVDHINHNVADNRKKNLRVVSSSQNVMNTKPRKNRTGYRGIHPVTGSSSYQATIYIDGKSYYLGCYKTLEEAVEARKQAEKKYFGEYLYNPNQDYRNQESVQE